MSENYQVTKLNMQSLLNTAKPKDALIPGLLGGLFTSSLDVSSIGHFLLYPNGRPRQSLSLPIQRDVIIKASSFTPV